MAEKCTKGRVSPWTQIDDPGRPGKLHGFHEVSCEPMIQRNDAVALIFIDDRAELVHHAIRVLIFLPSNDVVGGFVEVAFGNANFVPEVEHVSHLLFCYLLLRNSLLHRDGKVYYIMRGYSEIWLILRGDHIDINKVAV